MSDAPLPQIKLWWYPPPQNKLGKTPPPPPTELFFHPLPIKLCFCTTPNWIIFSNKDQNCLGENQCRLPKMLHNQWVCISRENDTLMSQCFKFKIIMCIVLVVGWHMWKHGGLHVITIGEWNLSWYCFIFTQCRCQNVLAWLGIE